MARLQLSLTIAESCYPPISRRHRIKLALMWTHRQQHTCTDQSIQDCHLDYGCYLHLRQKKLNRLFVSSLSIFKHFQLQVCRSPKFRFNHMRHIFTEFTILCFKCQYRRNSAYIIKNIRNLIYILQLFHSRLSCSYPKKRPSKKIKTNARINHQPLVGIGSKMKSNSFCRTLTYAQTPARTNRKTHWYRQEFARTGKHDEAPRQCQWERMQVIAQMRVCVYDS